MYKQVQEKKKISTNQNGLLKKNISLSLSTPNAFSLETVLKPPSKYPPFPVRENKQPRAVTVLHAFLSVVASHCHRGWCQGTHACSWPCPNEENQTQGSPARKHLANSASYSVALESLHSVSARTGEVCVLVLSSSCIAAPLGGG